MPPGSVQEPGKRFPGLLAFWSALDHDVIDEPAFELPAPGPDVDLDAVFLDIGAGGQKQTARRNRAGFPAFAPFIEALPVGGFACLDPGLAQHGVAEGPNGLVGTLCGLPRSGDALPG